MKSDGIMLSDRRWTGGETEVGAERAGSVQTMLEITEIIPPKIMQTYTRQWPLK